MRTKTLLLAAALSVAGIASYAQSNVYSVNVVGYVNVTIPANKYALVSTPLNFTGAGGNNITNVVGGTIPDGTFLFPFSGGSFQDAEQYFDGFGWFPGTTDLAPGSGYFVKTPASAGATLTFVGEVVQGPSTNALASGFSLKGSKVAQSVPLGDLTTSEATTMHFPAADNDAVTFYDVPTQSYKDAIQYFNGYGWFDPGPSGPGPVTGPSPGVAEAMFVFKPGAAANWTRSFTVQ
jgi:hypothetical protein